MCPAMSGALGQYQEGTKTLKPLNSTNNLNKTFHSTQEHTSLESTQTLDTEVPVEPRTVDTSLERGRKKEARVVFRGHAVGEDVDVELAPERPLDRSLSEEARVRKHLLKSERTLTPTRRVTQQGVRRPNALDWLEKVTQKLHHCGLIQTSKSTNTGLRSAAVF